MRKDAEDFTVQSAPAISIAVSELKKVNRALELVIPWFRVNPGVLIVYLNKSAGTNHRMQRVIIHPNESVEIFPKTEILNERDRYFAPSLHHAGEKIGFFNPRSRIEPHWKTHTAFPVMYLGGNEMSPGQFDSEPSCVDLIQIDPKEQKEVHEINSIECAQCKEFVDTWDPSGVLDLHQRTMGDTISLVPL